MKTKNELIEDVAGQLERDETPFSAEWIDARQLADADVRGLGQSIAVILRGYLALPPADRIRFVTAGCLSDRNKNKPA